MLLREHEAFESYCEIKAASAAVHSKTIHVTPGAITSTADLVTVQFTRGHDIPAGVYRVRAPGKHVLELKELPSAALREDWPEILPVGGEWKTDQFTLNMEIAPLQEHLHTLTGSYPAIHHVKPAFTVRRGHPITIIYKPGQDHAILNCQGMTIVLAPPRKRVEMTRVLVTGVPVAVHLALKAKALAHGTSANKVIVAALTYAVQPDK